jgi:rhodanese-related sulfurtransferase
MTDHHHSTVLSATVEEIQSFMEQAGGSSNVYVVDLRHADLDADSIVKSPLPDGVGTVRPHGFNLPWNKETKDMPLPPDDLPKDTFIITHCGAGTRGQLGLEYLKEHGYTNVINGGGPKYTEKWDLFGHL